MIKKLDATYRTKKCSVICIYKEEKVKEEQYWTLFMLSK